MANDVIIERVVIGRYVRVTAVDPVTGTEVMIIADAFAPPAAAAQIAARKLQRELQKINK
jgi:hypothetical protein